MYNVDVLIIGSGPAGYTAGLYVSRAGLNVLLCSGTETGGQLMYTHEIENYPPFTKISGVDLMDMFSQQLKTIGTPILNEKVIRLNLKIYPFEFETETQKGTAKTVIIATGSKAKWLGAEGEQKFKGKGISVCATCDGFFYKNKIVAVIGGGNTALYEAYFLARVAKQVYLINRSENLKGDNTLINQILNNPKITLINNTIAESFNGFDKLESVSIYNSKTKERKNLEVQGVFEAIGTEPQTELFVNQLNLSNDGYIETNKRTMETSVAGVFACGDVQETEYRQAVIASGSGCIAALSAEKFLQMHNHL